MNTKIFAMTVVCAQAPAAKRKRVLSFFWQWGHAVLFPNRLHDLITDKRNSHVVLSVVFQFIAPQHRRFCHSQFVVVSGHATSLPRLVWRRGRTSTKSTKLWRICETHSATWYKIFAAWSASIHRAASAATSCQSDVPSGAAPFAFPGPAWYEDMRWEISGKKIPKLPSNLAT